MAHLLFVDANESTLFTMRTALRRGHTLSLVKGRWEYFERTPWIDEVLAQTRTHELAVTCEAESLTAAIRAVHERSPIDAVVSQLEPSLEATSVACQRLAIPFTDPVGVANARNKAVARHLLERAGLRTAACAVVHDPAHAVREADAIGYPVVVKPVSGMDSILAFRADDAAAVEASAAAILRKAPQYPEQLREQLLRGVLVEEHLQGELVSVELAMIEGTCHRFMVCGRSRGLDNDCDEMGAALPAALAPHDAQACFDYGEAVCRALGLDLGVFHIEMILTPSGPNLVEVNPRAMGGIMTMMYEHVTGVDFGDHIIDTYMRRPPTVPEQAPRQTITARKLMPKAPGVLPDSIDLAWFQRLVERGDVLAFHNYKLFPGQAYQEREVLARYVVRADTWAETMGRADRYIEDFDQRLGIPLLKSAPSI